MKIIFDYHSKKNKGIIISDILNLIRNHFSVPIENQRFQHRFGNPHINNRNHIITAAGYFDLGLTSEIETFIKQSNWVCEVEKTKEFIKQIDISIINQVSTLPQLKIPLRDYQYEAVKGALENGRGVIEIATAGGKTLIMATLVNACFLLTNSLRNIFIILPTNLVNQTYNDFLEYGLEPAMISKWSGNDEFEKKPIIIAGTHILYSKLINDKENKTNVIKQIEHTDVLVMDEIHQGRKNNQLNKIIDIFKTNHRFGLTGTMPEDKIDQWNIIGKIGPILIDIKSHQLRERNYISNLKIQILYINYKENEKTNHLMKKSNIDINNPTKLYLEEMDFLYTNEYRNKVILKLIEKVENNVLVMVDRIEYGLHLEKLAKETIKKDIHFIQGDVEMEDREKVRKLMEENKNVVCIAITKIFSTGINIKNLHYIIFTQSSKAKITLLQSIGRSLRLCEGKKLAVIFDIADNLLYSKAHLEKRIEYYKQEKIPFERKEINE